MKIDTTLAPSEFAILARADLHATACVVFDILRATSTFVQALQNGAAAIYPVQEISEAVALKMEKPEVLLAGERDGVKIRAAESGGVDFDFGNSPREFIPEKIGGRSIVSTTTNGTRALCACDKGKTVLAASFLNLTATADFIEQQGYSKVMLVCAGTGEQPALEDVLAAGAFTELLAVRATAVPELTDAAKIAQATYLQAQPDFTVFFESSQNAQRLLAIPSLRSDVAFCRQRDTCKVVAERRSDGAIHKR